MKLLYAFYKSEFPNKSKVTLPVGIKKAKFMFLGGYCTIAELGSIGSQPMNLSVPFEFPIIDGKSPNTFTIDYWESNATVLYILINELGGIPDPNYFSDTPTVIPEIISDEPTEQEEKKDAI